MLTTRSPSAMVQTSGNDQSSSPAMLSSMKAAMAARPSTRPHAGSTNTASSVKNSSPRLAQVRSPRATASRASTRRR